MVVSPLLARTCRAYAHSRRKACRRLKGQLNDWLKTVLDKMDGVAQTAQSEVRKACTDLLEKQQHAFSEALAGILVVSSTLLA